MNTRIFNLAIACLVAAVSSGCLQQEATDGDVSAAQEELSTALDVDFSSYPLGPLRSPWSVTTQGTGSASIVKTSDQGNALRVSHKAERDYSASKLPVSYSGTTTLLEFKVKPEAKSTFTVTLANPGLSYSPGISLSIVPSSNQLTITSSYPMGLCGALPYGKWSTVSLTIHPDPDSSFVDIYDVRVNGVATDACTAVLTRLKLATSLQIIDDEQPTSTSDVLFDNFHLQGS